MDIWTDEKVMDYLQKLDYDDFLPNTMESALEFIEILKVLLEKNRAARYASR